MKLLLPQTIWQVKRGYSSFLTFEMGEKIEKIEK